MICTLCQKEISGYKSSLNHLDIDENKSVEICLACLDKIANWQVRIGAKLFPTKLAKKRYI